MRYITTLALFALPLFAQAQDLSVTGDAEIQVTPDRVRLALGVETRDKLLAQARLRNDSGVKAVLAAVRAIGVDSGDIQTDFMKVDMRYQNGDGTAVDYYIVEKTIAVTLKNVARFEDLLNAVLDAGANHIYDVDFTTTELRKHRDEARALAAKAALEKARDLAITAGMSLIEKPAGISTSSYGGGSWYGRFRNGAFVSQNVYQNASGSTTTGSIALGKISVTASVSMTFHLQ